MITNQETAIRAIVASSINGYASGFSDRHLSEVNSPTGVINMKIHNIFIAALGSDIQYYSALARSLDSSLGNMLENMAIQIARLNYIVNQYVDGYIYEEQTSNIARLLEEYKRHTKKPSINDYSNLTTCINNNRINKRHDSDYYLFDEKNNIHHLIELKIGGDLDNKKARSEKEAILEQYCILKNNLGNNANIKIHFATAYNRYGEGNPWTQSRVLQFFSQDELLISRDFWNMICCSENGYDIVIDEYEKNAHTIIDALERIKNAYLQE
ncbi:MAG: TdeIII family type II restriction endonuclease [bacterium]